MLNKQFKKIKVCKCGFKGEESKFRKNRNICKKCVAEYGKKYREEHKEEFRVYKRKFKKTKKGKLAEKRYVNSHKEQINKRNRELYKENPISDKKRKASIHKYRQTDKYKIIHKQSDSNRYALRKGANGKFTLKEFYSLLKSKFDNKCNICSCEFNKDNIATIDHIIPLTKNGSNNIENIQPLCKSCNSRKFNKLLDISVYRIKIQGEKSA